MKTFSVIAIINKGTFSDYVMNFVNAEDATSAKIIVKNFYRNKGYSTIIKNAIEK